MQLNTWELYLPSVCSGKLVILNPVRRAKTLPLTKAFGTVICLLIHLCTTVLKLHNIWLLVYGHGYHTPQLTLLFTFLLCCILLKSPPWISFQNCNWTIQFVCGPTLFLTSYQQWKARCVLQSDNLTRLTCLARVISYPCKLKFTQGWAEIFRALGQAGLQLIGQTLILTSLTHRSLPVSSSAVHRVCVPLSAVCNKAICLLQTRLWLREQHSIRDPLLQRHRVL